MKSIIIVVLAGNLIGFLHAAALVLYEFGDRFWPFALGGMGIVAAVWLGQYTGRERSKR